MVQTHSQLLLGCVCFFAVLFFCFFVSLFFISITAVHCEVICYPPASVPEGHAMTRNEHKEGHAMTKNLFRDRHRK